MTVNTLKSFCAAAALFCAASAAQAQVPQYGTGINLEMEIGRASCRERV